MSAEETKTNPPQKPERRSRIADALVVIFCVSGAVFSLNLFRLDLFQSIASQNKKPMGAVTVKNNNVQRRFSDRVLWSRLTVDSPVYLGDLIRVAEYSAATLNINDGIIDINENSLIRIRTSGGEDRIVIDLSSGSLSITGSDDADGGVALSVKGRVITPTAGATLSASSGDNGVTLQVNKGSAIITGEDGQNRSMDAGEALILDTKGAEQAAPAAVVTLPRPNARLIKNGVEPLNIRFAWNVINIDQRQPLRLEVASGPNFTRIVQTTEGVDYSNISLGAGTWYWRLSYQDTVLSSGQITVIDAAISASTANPVPTDSQIIYQEYVPIRFEWRSVEGVSFYILEASLTPDFINPSITRQTAIASYVESNMEEGTWYWHVKPVFSSIYEGDTAFSQVSSFNIEKRDKIEAAAQTADNSAATQVQPEPEPKSAAVSKPAKPVTPSVSSQAQTPEIIPEKEIIQPETTIISSAFISPTAGWKSLFDGNSKANISIGREIIDGVERDVLTINNTIAGGTAKFAGASLTEEDYFSKILVNKSNAKWTGNTATDMELIKRIATANGIRFKVLGDGQKWRVYFATTDVSDTAYNGLTITTQNGKVSNIDIPYNKLNQPDWGMRIRFNKNNVKGITIERSSEIGISKSTSSIKIFDFEVY